MKTYRNLFLANVLGATLYTALYFLFSGEWQGESFPVQLAVFISVHGIGLTILSMVQQALRNQEMRNAVLLAAAIILGLGWTLIYLTY